MGADRREEVPEFPQPAVMDGSGDACRHTRGAPTRGPSGRSLCKSPDQAMSYAATW